MRDVRFAVVLIAILAVLPAPGNRAIAAPVAAEPKAVPQEERVCVPPGLPPFSTWRGGPAEPMVSVDEWGRPILVIERMYLAQGRKLRAFWVGGLLALVDDAPDNPAESAWQDTGVVAPDLSPRVDAKQTCRWVKPPPKAPAEERT